MYNHPQREGFFVLVRHLTPSLDLPGSTARFFDIGGQLKGWILRARGFANMTYSTELQEGMYSCAARKQTEKLGLIKTRSGVWVGELQ